MSIKDKLLEKLKKRLRYPFIPLLFPAKTTVCLTIAASSYIDYHLPDWCRAYRVSSPASTCYAAHNDIVSFPGVGTVNESGMIYVQTYHAPIRLVENPGTIRVYNSTGQVFAFIECWGLEDL